MKSAVKLLICCISTKIFHVFCDVILAFILIYDFRMPFSVIISITFLKTCEQIKETYIKQMQPP